MKRKNAHIPIIPLDISDHDNSIDKELVVRDNNLYIYSNDTGSKLPDDIITAMQKRLEEDRRHEIDTVKNKKVYGIEISTKESHSGANVKYTNNAIGFTKLHFDDNNEVNYGSWKNIISNFFGVEPVLVERFIVDGTEYTTEEKLELDNYDKIIDEYFENEVIFGFELDLINGNVIYTNANKGYAPLKTFYDKIGYYFDNWNNFLFKFLGVRVCALDDNGEIYDIDYYHQDKKTSGEDITDDNIMVKIRRNYYMIKVKNDKLIFKIANYKPSEEYTDFIFNGKDQMYIGAYLGSHEDGKLVSKPNKDICIGSTDLVQNELLIDRYTFLYCIGVLLSKNVSLSNAHCIKPILARYTGGLKEWRLFGHDNEGNKALGMEDIFYDGGAIKRGIQANGTKLIIDTPPTGVIKNYILLSADNLSYINEEFNMRNMIKLSKLYGDMILTVNGPVRLFM